MIFAPNEHYLNQKDGYETKRITDSSFIIEEAFDNFQDLMDREGNCRHYLWECQSHPSNHKILFRIYEYAAQVGLDQESQLDSGKLVVNIPRSAVLFLRSNENTADAMEIIIKTESGQTSLDVHVTKMDDYSIDEIFQKKLFLLLPFYLFRFERQFQEIENDAHKIQGLVSVFQDIQKRLELLIPEDESKVTDKYGLVDTFTLQTLNEMAKKVARNLTEKYPKIKEGVLSVMGGQILDYEAKRIRNQGIAVGKEIGEEIGEEKLGTLMEKLLSEGLINEARKAAMDLETRKQMYDKYQIG